MTSVRALDSRKTVWVVAGGLVVLCAWMFPYFPRLGSPNELTRLYLTRAIVDDATFAVDGPVERYGRVLDLAAVGGKLYSDKAPGIGLLGVPIYAAIKAWFGWDAGAISNATLLWWLRFGLAGLPTAAAALLLFFLLRRLELERDTRLLLMIGYGTGTIALAYGVLLFGHQLSTLCLLAGFACAERDSRSPGLLGKSGTGLCLGASLLAEYTTVLLAAPIAIYALWVSPRRWQTAVLGLAGALPPLLLLGVYHNSCFGSPFATGYAHLASAHYASVHGRGLMGMVSPSLPRFLVILFSPTKGLWFYSPWLLLALPGMARGVLGAAPVGVRGLRRAVFPGGRAAFAAIAVSSACYLLFSASLELDAWGWSLGPRHLCPLLPFWTLAVGALLQSGPAACRWTLRALRVLLPASAVLIALPIATFGGFPPDFSNPLADFSAPLLASGCVAPSLGSALGLVPLAGAMPFFMALLALIGAVAFLGPGSRREKLVSLALAAALVALVLAWTGPASAQEQQALTWARCEILGCTPCAGGR